MFDDPKKELHRLQERLLEAEAPEEEPEEPDLEELKVLLDTDDWEGTHRQPLYQSYSEDAEEDSYADWLPEEDEDEPPPPPRKRSLGGLIAALILETLALVGVVIWWLLWK